MGLLILLLADQWLKVTIHLHQGNQQCLTVSEHLYLYLNHFLVKRYINLSFFR